MRKYEEQKEKLIEAVCNCCGRALKVENGYLKEGCVAVIHLNLWIIHNQ